MQQNYEMLKRYLDHQDVLLRLQAEDIDDLILTAQQSKEAENICKDLHGLDTLTNALESESLTIAEKRALFEEVHIIASFTYTERRMAVHADIVFQPPFEAAVGKIQSGRSFELIDEDRQNVAFLKKYELSKTLKRR